MFEKILLATDGSEDSLKAARYALELAQKNGATVEIIHVQKMIPVYGREKEFDQSYTLPEEVLAYGKEIVTRTGKIFDDQGIPYETKIVAGDPPAVICGEAETRGVQMIIIGTRGKSGVARWLMGSVSSKVVAYAHCTVLVVR